MQRILGLTLFLLLLFAGACFAMNGSGTLSNPYIITNCQELQSINLRLDANYALGNDINCSDMSDPIFVEQSIPYFVPIGDYFTQKECEAEDSDCIISQWHYNQPFTGNFDGKGFDIKNILIVDNSSSSSALFLQVSQNSTIKDFILENSLVSSSMGVGSIAGTNKGMISNVNVKKGRITGSDSGGLVGYNYGTIDSSSFEEDFYGSGWDVGGLAGINFNTITNSHAKGKVSGGYQVGGIVGVNREGGSISNSYFQGSVSGSGNNVGGLAALNEGIIKDSYADGNISSAGLFTGGVSGSNRGQGQITNVYFSGDINANNYAGGISGEMGGNSSITLSRAIVKISGGDYVGGVVGYIDSNGFWETCKYPSCVPRLNQVYFTGELSGGNAVGGIVGTAEGSQIDEAYSNGKVTGSGMYVGGIIGLSGLNKMSNLYSSAEISGNIFVGGIIGEYSLGEYIDNAYFIGKVSGDDYVGGLVGYQFGSMLIRNSYSLGVVQSNGENKGGAVGYIANPSNPSLSNVYWDPILSGISNCYYGADKDQNNYCNLTFGEESAYFGPTGIPFSTLKWSSSVWTASDINHPLLNIIPACMGEGFKSASFWGADETPLTLKDNSINILTNSDTNKTCEWHCSAGYMIDSGADINRCIKLDAVCEGTIPLNSSICPDDNIDLDNNYSKLLVQTCDDTRKCQYHCEDQYKLYINASQKMCIPSNWIIPKCGPANKSYYPGITFPDGNYCSVGTQNPVSSILGDEVGSSVTWKCVTDLNIDCTARRIAPVPVSNACSILSFDANQTQGTVIINAKCSCNTQVDLTFTDYANTTELEVPLVQFYCGENTISQSIGFSSPITEETLIQINANIENYTQCNTCMASTYLTYIPQKEEQTIPDNSLIFVLLIALISIAIIQKKRI